MKYFVLLLTVLLVGCGARKVDLHKRINDIETTLNVKIKELEVERKKLSEYIYSENFRADSIIEENGKRKIYNPIIDKKQEQKVTEEEKTNEVEKDTIQTEKDKSTIKDKVTERAQFNWLSLFVLLTLGIIIWIKWFKNII